MDPAAGRILVGTCAWSDHEGFYPGGLAPGDRLPFYARHFPLVEVDSTYYRLQPERNFRLWAQRTPPGFRFDVKAYRSMTRHVRPGQEDAVPAEEAFLRFTAALEPLREAGKLRAVLFQFPPWFRRGPEAVRYLEEVRARMEGFLVAVEFRHASWFAGAARARTLDLLRDLGFVHVVCDEPQVGTGCVPAVVEVTHPELAVVRFHGRNRATWYLRGGRSADRFRYLYGEDELREWVPHVRLLAERAREVHLLMNNNYGDYAVRNAFQLARLLGLDYPEPPAAHVPAAGLEPGGRPGVARS